MDTVHQNRVHGSEQGHDKPRPASAECYGDLVTFLRERSWADSGQRRSLESTLVDAIQVRFDATHGSVTRQTATAGCAAVVDDKIAVMAITGAQLNDKRTVRSWLQVTAKQYSWVIVCGLNVTDKHRDTWRSLRRNYAGSHLAVDSIDFVSVDSTVEPIATPGLLHSIDVKVVALVAMVIMGTTFLGVMADAYASMDPLALTTIVGAGLVYAFALSFAGIIALGR